MTNIKRPKRVFNKRGKYYILVGNKKKYLKNVKDVKKYYTKFKRRKPKRPIRRINKKINRFLRHRIRRKIWDSNKVREHVNTELLKNITVQ